MHTPRAEQGRAWSPHSQPPPSNTYRFGMAPHDNTYHPQIQLQLGAPGGGCRWRCALPPAGAAGTVADPGARTGGRATCGVVHIQARPCNEYPDVNTTHPISPHLTASPHTCSGGRSPITSLVTHATPGGWCGGTWCPVGTPKWHMLMLVTRVLLHVAGGETQVPKNCILQQLSTPHGTAGQHASSSCLCPQRAERMAYNSTRRHHATPHISSL